MNQVLDIRVPYNKITSNDFIHSLVLKKLKIKEPIYFKILKRSIDARKKTPYFQLRVEISNEPYSEVSYNHHINELQIVKKKDAKVIIIGAGPAGYFAGLECIRLGMRPVIIERGKDVRERRRDLKAIQQDAIVNPNSNYCFGEGGAGTYSDGKLYTRSYKRGVIENVLQTLVAHGAKEDILIDAHPHIGSNKLPAIVSNIRKTIEAKGGSVLFNTKIVDFVIENQKIRGVRDDKGEIHTASAYILATGHSARDIYDLLDRHKVRVERKPFALGVRVEHPQALIDEIQYSQNPRSEYLPASSYKLVAQVEDKGVFSFCMCPGGLIVPAATTPGEIVVNGMSLSKRDSPYANSGIVTAIDDQDLQHMGTEGVFANLDFQRKVEQSLFEAGNGSQQAPAQRLIDFVEAKPSKDLNPTSYIPGLVMQNLHELLPPFVYQRLSEGLKVFGRKMKGYLTNEANVVGIESRTSAPIRIPRNPDTLMHPSVELLFPSGEGAGYAGGILSAAMDGQNVARAVARQLQVF